ncbi:hypothetical protein HMI55_001415 [Coelomomyces lativittatus]|nr:hypothetical protein HMI55_001415 [Coelomomyces lativittatus]
MAKPFKIATEGSNRNSYFIVNLFLQFKAQDFYMQYPVDVAAKSIGNFNVIEPKAYISENTTLEDHCIIGTSSQTQPSQTIKSYTILYGSNPVQQRSHPPEFLHEHDMLFESHLAHLRSVLPKHNQMRKNSL